MNINQKQEYSTPYIAVMNMASEGIICDSLGATASMDGEEDW